MADLQIRPQVLLTFVDKRRVVKTGSKPASAGTEDQTSITTSANLIDIETLKATLVAADATAYAAAKTASMTVNDLVYAARLVGESSGI